MYIWRVTHKSGYVDSRTLEGALIEYSRRTKGGHKATINPIWKTQKKS